jgi:hypothetical protein
VIFVHGFLAPVACPLEVTRFPGRKVELLFYTSYRVNLSLYFVIHMKKPIQIEVKSYIKTKGNVWCARRVDNFNEDWYLEFSTKLTTPKCNK